MNIRHRVRAIGHGLHDKLCDVINTHALDLGKAEDVLIVAGMGRSGTTWICDLINYDNRYRVVFEPFYPALVPEARVFDERQYLRPDCDDTTLTAQARQILAGHVHNRWVNRDPRGWFYRARIIKDIRCNLMLGWLRSIAHNPPIVLVVRHPLQVAASMIQLGETAVASFFINRLTEQSTLLQDFPVIQEVWRQINRQDFMESIVFQWCVYHFVPAQQLRPEDAHVIFYEELLTDAPTAILALFHYLERPLFSEERAQALMTTPSSTNFLKRDFSQDRALLLNSWKDAFSKEAIQRALAIIAAFGLDHLYDDDGYPTGAPLLGNGAQS